MAAYTLYGHPRSGNAYKTALMLSMTGTPYDFRLIDLMDGSNLLPEYLAVNPMGKVPTLVHGDLIIRQSFDTLRYLFEQTGQFGYANWEEQARIGDWIGFSVDYFSFGLARLRFERLFGAGDQTDTFAHFKKSADRGLGIIEPHLGENDWLACGRPTIADMSCYPVATFMEDAGYNPADYPNFSAWRTRFEALPGWGSQLDLMPSPNWPPKK
ncbi:MAG: glutathione S-transferase family protein [Alphaproteobacteria bacterium]